MLASFMSSRLKEVCMYTQSFYGFQLFATPQTIACQALCPLNFPGENIGLGCHFLFQGVFLTQGSNPGSCASCLKTLFTCVWETRVQSLIQEDPLKKEVATHSSTFAWKIPWTKEPGRLQSMGLQRVGHDSLSTCLPPHHWGSPKKVREFTNLGKNHYRQRGQSMKQGCLASSRISKGLGWQVWKDEEQIPRRGQDNHRSQVLETYR